MADKTREEIEKEEREAAAKKVTDLINGIREELGQRNTDLQARLTAIEKSRETQGADLGKLRAELDTLRSEAKQREDTIREIERRNNLRLEQDPVRSREQALGMLGMMARQDYFRVSRAEIPALFAKEREQVDAYVREARTRATLGEQTTAGGYFMPTVLQLGIYDTLEQVSELLSVIDFQSGVPTKGAFVTLTGRPTLQPKRASSDTSLAQSDPAFGTFDWDTEEAGFSFPIDNWMFQLSPIDLGSRLVPLCRDAYIQGLCDWLINADGTASYNSMSGMLADTVNVVRMTGTAFSDLTNDDLRKLMRAVLRRARVMGSFVGGPYAIDVLEGIDRTGKIPVLRESADGSYVVKGKRFVEDEGMPDETDSAAGAAFLAFGDPKTWAVVLAANGLQIAFDSSIGFRANQTWYRALGHVDIVRKPGNTWALLKAKAQA